jgi:hypothetical protein
VARKPEIDGIEFDWFCFDRHGRLGIFATGGEGQVPNEVLDCSEVHGSLGDSIEVVNGGTPEVWASYTAVGLYVYDWDVRRRAYVRLAKPARSVPSDLAEAIGDAQVIPRLDADFDHDETIQIE